MRKKWLKNVYQRAKDQLFQDVKLTKKKVKVMLEVAYNVREKGG